jgi:hypothetical protein
MPKRFDRNGLKNLIHLQVDEQFTEYTINLMKLWPSVTLQKVIDRSVLPPRKTKCESDIYEEPPEIKTKSFYWVRHFQQIFESSNATFRFENVLAKLLHGLLQDDPDDKRQGNGIIDKITWSDEAHFKLWGAVNQHKCVYYSTKNPHVTIEGQLNQPGIRVWAGLLCKGVDIARGFGTLRSWCT